MCMTIIVQLIAHGRWFSPGTPASSNIREFNTEN